LFVGVNLTQKHCNNIISNLLNYQVGVNLTQKHCNNVISNLLNYQAFAIVANQTEEIIQQNVEVYATQVVQETKQEENKNNDNNNNNKSEIAKSRATGIVSKEDTEVFMNHL